MARYGTVVLLFAISVATLALKPQICFRFLSKMCYSSHSSRNVGVKPSPNQSAKTDSSPSNFNPVFVALMLESPTFA